MQDARTNLEAGSAAAQPVRPVGVAGLILSLIAILLCMGLWFGIFAALVMAGALAFDGMQAIDDLIQNFDRFDPRRLADDAGAQRALFAAGALIYLAALASLLTVARLIARGNAGELLGWRGAWPSITPLGWKLIALAGVYHIAAGGLLRYFFPDFAPWLISPRDGLALALSFLMIVVLAPLVEELLFRGWIFGSLRARFSAGFTILVATLLFAIVHWDPTGLYPVAVLLPGYVLSVIRERTGSVKPAILAHAIYNLVGWLLLVLAGVFLLR
jgi:membrane protease YdiL (CAAX protease family)